MPEGVLSLSRTLENESRKALNLQSGLVREPRRLYLSDRMSTLRALKLHSIDGAQDLQKNPHLGNIPRGKIGRAPLDTSSGRAEAMAQFNRGRDREFAEELARLSKTIGGHLAQGGSVPDGLWSSFDNLNVNRVFFRKSEDEALSQSRLSVGPGAYLNPKFEARGGTTFGSGGGGHGASGRTQAQLQAVDRIKHRESSFRVTKDFSAIEQDHLQRLFEEFGRPPCAYSRGERNYEEHLEKFGYRHIQIFPRRSFEEVKERVHASLKKNSFKEVGESKYWREVGVHGAEGCRHAGFASSTQPRAPRWDLGRRIEERAPTPPPGPEEGGSEPYEYRSIGNQIDSEKKDRGSVTFTKAGAAGSTLTIAEQLANLTPTSTTYRPSHSLTRLRPLAYPWRRDNGEVADDKESSMLGPGAYEATPMSGPQVDSRRRSNNAGSMPKAWSKRLPRELEPVTEKYASTAPLPPPPRLLPLQP